MVSSQEFSFVYWKPEKSSQNDLCFLETWVAFSSYRTLGSRGAPSWHRPGGDRGSVEGPGTVGASCVPSALAGAGPLAAAADGECPWSAEIWKSLVTACDPGAPWPLASHRGVCVSFVWMFPLLFLKSLLARGLGKRRFRITAGARGEGRRLLGSALLVGSEKQFQDADLLCPPVPLPPCRGTQFVLGCESKQCLRWQPLLFRWSLLPRQETAVLAGRMAFPTFPRFKETDFTTFF